MYDLIYGGGEYESEIKKIFPKCKIENASDEVHEDRISIDVELEDKEYFRRIFLNGFGQMSLGCQMLDNKDLKLWVSEWQKDYPQYFKGETNEKDN